MDFNQISTSGEEFIYDLLCKNEIPFEQKFESLSYIKELCSYGVDKLQYEPKRLKDDKDAINDEIQTYAFNNYKTFIKTAECSREIYQEFSTIDQRLDSLIAKIPDLNDKCDGFTRNIQNINQARRSNNLTLQKHNQILELLEIAQLMDTCVRNEYYDEALELSSYVTRMEKKFGSIQLIKQLNTDVKQSLDLMLKQLLEQLKQELQFPLALKIIGLIRRLNVFNESQLRVKFLQSRDCWLNKILNNITSDDAYTFLSKTIDETRVHLFDIITQYRALFSDDDLILLNQKNDLAEANLFNCWLMSKIDTFLACLRDTLSKDLSNRLDSILSQCMYFGLSFSRVGLDFRVSLIEIFEKHIQAHLKQSINQANKKFDESMSKFNFNDLNDSSSPQSTTYLPYTSNSLNPPLNLIEFIPLGVYLNELLLAFNELRLCMPLTLMSKCKQDLQDSLEYLSRQILKYIRNESSELRVKFVNAFCYDLVPFIQKCLCVLYPIQQIQSSLSIQQNDLDLIKQLSYFDTTKIFSDFEQFVAFDLDLYKLKLNNGDKTIDAKNSEIVEVN